jgi:hypothetical protein
MAMATLAKGIIGVVLPCGVVAVFVAFTRRFKLLWEVGPVLGAAVFFAFVVPWFVLVQRTIPEFLHYFVVDQHVAQPATSPQEHEGFGDSDTRQPGGKGRPPFEFAQMDESFLKALLHDILGVFSRAGHAARNKENPLLVSPDQDFKCAAIAAFGGNDERRIVRGRINERKIPSPALSIWSPTFDGITVLLRFSLRLWHSSNCWRSIASTLAEGLRNAHRDIRDRQARPAQDRPCDATEHPLA